jgi:WD40 repeat protein
MAALQNSGAASSSVLLMNGELFTPQGHDAGLTDCDFSPDGGRIVTASEDATARVWEVGAAGGAELFPLRGHRDVVTCASFSPDGAGVLTGSEDATLRLWPVAWKGEPRVIEAPPQKGRAAGAPNRVTSAAFSPDGSRLVATVRGVASGVVRNTDTEQELVASFLAGDQYTMSSPSCAVYSPDGTRMAIAFLIWSGGDAARVPGTLLISDLTGDRRFPPLGHQIPAASAGFSSDGSRIVSGHQDATARVWDAGAADWGAGAEDLELLVLRGHEGPVTSAAFSPDGGRIVTASADTTARVWRGTVDDDV